MIPRSSVWAAWIPVMLVLAVVQVRRRATFGHTIAVLFLTTYAFGVLSVTLLPLPIDSAGIAFERTARYLTNNYEPLRTIRDALGAQNRSSALVQLAGNFVLLVPLTFLGAFLWAKLRSWRRMLALGFGVAATIELLQLAISGLLGFTYKIADVDDVLLNTVGAAAGYAAFLLLRRLVGRRGARSRATGQAARDHRPVLKEV